jgi:NAD(P)H-dependent FMN reductase
MEQSNDTGDHKLRVLVFSAALRADSLNSKLATLAVGIAEAYGAHVHYATMHDFDVPAYDGDCESAEGIPPGAKHLEESLEACDAFIVASPAGGGQTSSASEMQTDRSLVLLILKNLIDWTSRIRPQPFDGTHGLLISASPSMAGGNRGLWSLRIPLEHLGARIFPDMFSLATAHTALVNGKIADPKLADRFEVTVRAFLDLAEAAKNYPCMKRAWVEVLGESPDLGADRVDPILTSKA